jgi:putative phosphoribosyl transferase
MADSVAQTVEEQLVSVPAGPVWLDGNLSLSEQSRAVVLFAHGSGSSRHSPRNRYVARVLNEAKLATLLIDLLTLDEEVTDAHTAQLRFDIGLLTERLVDATDWLTQFPDTKQLPIGYFGASTGAAAALAAAAVAVQAGDSRSTRITLGRWSVPGSAAPGRSPGKYRTGSVRCLPTRRRRR